MNNGNERKYYIDSAKAIGIVALIIGHATSGIIQSTIYSFHMPLFIIISGYLNSYKSRSDITFSELCYKKFKSLIIPYLFFEILFLLVGIFCLIIGYDCYYLATYRSIIGYVYNIFIGAGVGTLWFLPFLFGTEATFFILNKKKYGDFVLILLAVIVFITSPFIQNLSQSDLRIYSITGNILTVIYRVIVGVTFMYIGSFLYKLDRKIDDRNLAYIVLIDFVIWLVSVVLLKTPMVDLYSLKFSNVFRYYLNAITGSIFIIEACRFSFNRYTRFSEIFGGGSLLYMAFNTLPFTTIFAIIVNIYTGVSSWIIDVISIILVETLCVLIVKNNKCAKKILGINS